MPAEPTVYVCAQDRGDAETEPGAGERLLVLANAPATGDEPQRWNEAEKERCTTATTTLLKKMGLSLDVEASVQTTPADFERLFRRRAERSTVRARRGRCRRLSRQPATTKIPGLYLAGGSVHPGAGVPMAALSGRLAAERICEDLASIAPSRRAATTGTTSTE